MPYTLKLYSAVRQLHLNKTVRKKMDKKLTLNALSTNATLNITMRILYVISNILQTIYLSTFTTKHKAPTRHGLCLEKKKKKNTL